VPATLQDVQKAVEVRFLISERVRDRIPHPRLRRQIHNALGMTRFENAVQSFVVANVRFAKNETAGLAVVAPDDIQTVALQLDVVVGSEVVSPCDFVTLPQESGYQVESDESRRARNKNPHRFLPVRPR